MTDELQYYPTGLAKTFQPQSLLGRGAFGHVYLARDVKLDRLVAVKVLADLTAGDRGLELRQRFQREATAMARVAHPNLAQVFDHGVDGITPYFVLEYLEGSPLIPLPAGVAPLDVMLPIADALEAVHRSGLVHRDVKPSNMMLVGERPVLFDFGLMKDHRLGALTRTGALVGTPAYLPPEAMNSEAISPAADWYSWGVCLYELCEGKLPFEAGQVLEWISGRDPPELIFHTVDPVGPIAQVIRACLQEDPESRPAGRVQLLAILEGEGLQTEVSLENLPRQNSDPKRTPSAPSQGTPLPSASSVGIAPLSTQVNEVGRGLPKWLGMMWAVVIGLMVNQFWAIRADPTPAPAPAPTEVATTAPELPPSLTRLPAIFGRPPRFKSVVDGSVLHLLPPVHYRPRVSFNAEPSTPGDPTELPAILLGETEVTVGQFQRFMDATGHPPLHLWDDQTRDLFKPAVMLHREHAEAYCAWAGGRLPSADEWQHGAGGSLGLEYPWGNSRPDARRANYGNTDLQALVTSDLSGLSRVGKYPAGASPWGLLDMAGNVAEITSSRDPHNPDGFQACGGSWLAQEEWLRTHFRRGWPDNGGVNSIGFRLAMDVPEALRAEAAAIQPPAP